MNVCRNRRFFTAAAAAVLGVLVLAEPQAAKQGFASGTALCLDSVLPALFPFFVVCELLMAAPSPAVLLRPLQRVLGLESAEAAQAVVLSWVGGYARVRKISRAAVRRGENFPPGRCAAANFGVLLRAGVCHWLCGRSAAGQCAARGRAVCGTDRGESGGGGGLPFRGVWAHARGHT